MDRDYIDEMAEGAIILDGFDDCIVGISEEFGGETRIVYAKQRIIDKLIKTGLIDEEEALEYFYFNMVGGHFGKRNPIFLITSMAV
tara:strand:+ start:3254 stop:3511 length:258 start_codon:yes stop_codon:yes gene_type:complete